MNAAGSTRLLYVIDAVVAAVLAVWWLAEVRADPLDGTVQQAAAWRSSPSARPCPSRCAVPRPGSCSAILATCFGVALLLGAAGTGRGHRLRGVHRPGP